jgi:hypothetical protein
VSAVQFFEQLQLYRHYVGFHDQKKVPFIFPNPIADVMFKKISMYFLLPDEDDVMDAAELLCLSAFSSFQKSREDDITFESDLASPSSCKGIAGPRKMTG